MKVCIYILPLHTPFPSQCKDFMSRCIQRDVSKRARSEELLKHPWFAQQPAA